MQWLAWCVPYKHSHRPATGKSHQIRCRYFINCIVRGKRIVLRRSFLKRTQAHLLQWQNKNVKCISVTDNLYSYSLRYPSQHSMFITCKATKVHAPMQASMCVTANEINFEKNRMHFLILWDAHRTDRQCRTKGQFVFEIRWIDKETGRNTVTAVHSAIVSHGIIPVRTVFVETWNFSRRPAMLARS